MAKKEDYLTDNQARCLECYIRCKNDWEGEKDWTSNFNSCNEYQKMKQFLRPGELCWALESILTDIVKAKAGVKRMEGITNPVILRALAERGIEEIPREAYE